MIPNLAFSYWEGNEFTNLHLLTIQTFAFYNPTFRIILYTPSKESSLRVSWASGEHENIINKTADFYDLSKISNVSIIQLNMDDELKLSNNLTPVHRSDYIRVKKLYEHGGFWIDFDIFFIKPIPNTWLYSNQLNIIKYDTHENIPIGFIWAPPCNSIILEILNNIENTLQTNNKITEYQCIGANIWTKILKNDNNHITHNQTIIYPYLPKDLIKLFYKKVNKINADTIGIHWYNGDKITRVFLLDTYNNEIKSTINELITNFLLLGQ